MVLLFNAYFKVWMLWWWWMFVKGENLCKRELLMSINISIELQSDVLLPCNFNTILLGSNKTADIAVVWSQKNTTEHNLVEITLRGESRFWDYKGGRINTFPKLSESGNFSILLQNVQLYDLSLYRCELFNGTCSIAYQDLHLHRQQSLAEAYHQPIIITGASVGAAFLCLLIACVFYISKKRKARLHPEDTRSSHDNPIYVSFTKDLIPDTDASAVSESPIYGNVCSRGGSMR